MLLLLLVVKVVEVVAEVVAVVVVVVLLLLLLLQSLRRPSICHTSFRLRSSPPPPPSPSDRQQQLQIVASHTRTTARIWPGCQRSKVPNLRAQKLSSAEVPGIFTGCYINTVECPWAERYPGAPALRQIIISGDEIEVGIYCQQRP